MIAQMMEERDVAPGTGLREAAHDIMGGAVCLTDGATRSRGLGHGSADVVFSAVGVPLDLWSVQVCDRASLGRC